MAILPAARRSAERIKRWRRHFVHPMDERPELALAAKDRIGRRLGRRVGRYIGGCPLGRRRAFRGLGAAVGGGAISPHHHNEHEPSHP